MGTSTSSRGPGPNCRDQRDVVIASDFGFHLRLIKDNLLKMTGGKLADPE